MTGPDRTMLAMPSLEDDLEDFAPRGAGRATPPPAQETRRAVDAISGFPSREAAADAQLNLKGPRPILERFRALSRSDRRAYYDMLEILMDRFEATGGFEGPRG